MTELEQLRAERTMVRDKRDGLNCAADIMAARLIVIEKRIAELEREPKRWQPRPSGKHYRVGGDTCDALESAIMEWSTFNMFPTYNRAKEVATHFRRLGLAAQWGALLTDSAVDAATIAYYAPDKTYRFAFPTAAHRDGFMADAEKEGLL